MNNDELMIAKLKLKFIMFQVYYDSSQVNYSILLISYFNLLQKNQSYPDIATAYLGGKSEINLSTYHTHFKLTFVPNLF